MRDINNAIAEVKYSLSNVDKVIANRWNKGGRTGASIWGFPLKAIYELIDAGITCPDEVLMAYREWLQEDHFKRIQLKRDKESIIIKP